MDLVEVVLGVVVVDDEEEDVGLDVVDVVGLFLLLSEVVITSSKSRTAVTLANCDTTTPLATILDSDVSRCDLILSLTLALADHNGPAGFVVVVVVVVVVVKRRKRNACDGGVLVFNDEND